MREQRRDDDRANQLLDAARVVLEAAGGWEIPEGDDDDDPTRILRFTELYFSEAVRLKIWPYVDQMNRGIEAGDLEDLRLGVLGLLRVVRAPKVGRSEESETTYLSTLEGANECATIVPYCFCRS